MPMQATPTGRKLLPFFPMIYVAWAGGSVSPEELEAIHRQVAQAPDLDPDSRTLLAGWLDPESPPTPKQLGMLLASVREAARDLPDTARMTLADLGRAIARRQGEEDGARALQELEEALGATGEALPEELVGARDGRARPEAPAAFDVQAMQALLDRRFPEARQRIRTILAQPEFRHEYGLPRSAFRERVLGWSRELARRGVGLTAMPKSVGGEHDTGSFLAMWETLATFDLSLFIKAGVQFGLFGGSVQHLGTERHHREYLPRIASLELPGCFAMTETGHGSNVRDLETVACYDRERQQFVVHTPTRSARKDYIGNAALHGRMATVFAQLEIDGERYGVHAFLVPIRDEQNSPLPGISIEDCGEKIGLNGVDNGRLEFHHVRIPRENLLDRFAQVSPEGEYSSPILGESERFFTMLGTLVVGRISLAAGSLSAAKVGLAAAVRYGAVRRQFGPAGEPETRLLDYPSHQRRLMPLLANAYALDFAVKHLVDSYGSGSSRRLESLAAGVKAWGSWNAVETLQTCRECCGGQGYLAENRFGALKADTDVFTTFEGDNTVLMQLVAKGLLTDFRHQFSEMSFLGAVKYLSRLAATVLSDQNPLAVRNADRAHLRDPDFHQAAFRFREKTLRASLARRMKRRIEEGSTSYDAFQAFQDHAITLARAHVERQILRAFAAGIPEADPGLRPVLEKLCALFALSRLERDRAWFLEAGYFEPAKSKAVRAQVLELVAEVREQAVPLVDSFGLLDKCLAAPIAFLEG